MECFLNIFERRKIFLSVEHQTRLPGIARDMTKTERRRQQLPDSGAMLLISLVISDTDSEMICKLFKLFSP